MRKGHRLAGPRTTVPLRRSPYQGGTVSYDFTHEGTRVFVEFAADGTMQVVVLGRRLRDRKAPYTMRGISPKRPGGLPFTKVGLEPVPPVPDPA
jgi:hypothetical protein